MNEEIKVTVCKYPDRANLVLRYVDPITGKQKTKSAKTISEADAIKAAGKWEDELRSGRYAPVSRMTWAEFRKRHKDEFQPGVALKTRDCFRSAFNAFESLMNPALLRSVTTEVVSKWIVAMRDSGRKEATIACYCRHLRGAINWGKSLGFIHETPKFRAPKGEKMKGRPIVGEEHDRMLEAVAKMEPRGGTVEQWQRFLNGLWWSGLRLGEALALSWDESEPVAVIMQPGYHHALRFQLGGQKAKRAELVPCAPEFAELLEATPEADRHGRVFPIQLSLDKVGRMVSKIGKRSGVIVDEESGKPATAHDYRRAFGTRWSKRVMPAVLRRLMRHANIGTTLKYYVDQDAEEIAEDLWRAYGQGNNSGNTHAKTHK